MILRPPFVLALVLAAGLGPGCKGNDPAVTKAEALRQGDDLAAAGKFAAAADAYNRAVNADPNDGPLRVKLARAHEGAAQWTAAANQAMRAADLLPKDFEAQSLAARLILGQSRFDDSLKITTELRQAQPDNPDLLVLWGTATARLINPTWALFKLGPTGGTGPDYDAGCTSLRPRVGPEQDLRAEAALRRAVDLAPTSLDVRLALINFLWAARRAGETEPLIRPLADEQPGHGLVNEIAGYFFLARRQNDLGEQYLAQAADASASYSRAPRLALADHYEDAGRFDLALQHLEKMLPADDEAGTLAARRADLHLRLGHHDLAGKEIDALLARYPKHRRALALRAMLFMAQQRPADALAAARDAVAADRRSAEARAVLGDALTAGGDTNGAFVEYAEAVRLAPERTVLVPKLARLGLVTGRNEEALAYARQAVGLFPADVDAKVALVTANVRLRDYPAAQAALQPLLALKPRPLAVHLQVGLLEAGRGNEAAARAAFNGALAVDPDSLEALAGLVDLDLSRRQVAAARRRVDTALTRRGDDAGVLKIASRVFRAERNAAGAEGVLRRARAVQPADAETSRLLASALVAQGTYDEAAQLLQDVLTRHPTSADTLVALGAVLERLGRLDEAEARYKSVLASNPGDGPAATHLGLLHVTRGRNLDIALGYLSEAKRASPGDPAVSDALGWVYAQKNLRLLALEQLEEAVRLSPGTALFQYHLGVTYAGAGQAAKARAALSRAAALELDDESRRKVETALAALTVR